MLEVVGVWHEGVCSLFRASPTLDGARFRRKVHANFMNRSRIRLVLARIAFVLNLLQRPRRRAVELELKDIDELRRFDDAVHAPLALLLFNVHGIDAHESQQQIESVLEIPLALTLLVLAAHGVRNAGQESREHLAELVNFHAAATTPPV